MEEHRRVPPVACPKVTGKRTTAKDTSKTGISIVVKGVPRAQDAPVAEGEQLS